jgi:hypothetical protein
MLAAVSMSSTPPSPPRPSPTPKTTAAVIATPHARHPGKNRMAERCAVHAPAPLRYGEQTPAYRGAAQVTLISIGV